MHDDIADANVERLVETAYKPEPMDAAFAKRLEDARRAAARAERNIDNNSWPGPRYSEAPAGTGVTDTGASEYLSPGHAISDPKQRIIRRRLGWAMAMAASLAACFLVYYARTHRIETVMPAHVQTTDKTRPVSLGDPMVAMGLTARPRPETVAVEQIAVGATLVTKAGERRRVILTDGSVLYLNQNTEVKHVSDRHIDLTQGEIYLEVTPRDPRTADQGVEGATFRVKTPGREVSALGTRFGVQADARGPGVIVTQGKVKVSGLEGEIRAGQQLVVGRKIIDTAPRATHVLDWTRELMAAAQSPLVPGSKHAGGALVALDPNGQEVTLTLRKFHVDVHIEDGFARTTIDQTYFNNNNWRMEGTFYFPLPPDASLSRLAMYVEDGDASRLMEGGMAEREHARNVFETIMTQRRDPALLEWVDGSTFKMRVFPLEGRKEKRILLSYTQRLPSLYGAARYRFPAGHNMELVRDWSFEARVKHGADKRVTAASHPEMKIVPEGTDMVARAASRNVKPNQDVTLEIHDSTDANDAAVFTSFTHENQNYLMLKYRPALAAEPKRERRDWVILFETAANRDPLLARAQIDVVKNLLENVEHDDTFSLITANTRAIVFDTRSRPVTGEHVASAVKFLEESHLIGALDLHNALAAARPFFARAKNPYLVHVGAGIAAMGERKEDVLAKEVPENVRYVGIGVGKRWSRAFMKMAADRNGGFFTQINPDEPIAWRTFELLATLNTPRLMELRVIDAAERAAFLTETTSLAQGEEICAFTRTGGDLPAKVIVSGKLNGKAFTKKLEVKDVVKGAGYLPRTWAKLEIDRLLADGAEKNKKTIVDLSMAMYVMTPFTSLLVLETDQDYVTYKVDRGRKDHWAMYDSPQRIPTVFEPDPNQQVWNGIANNAVPAGKKKTAEEVLTTILVRIPPSFLVFDGREQNRQAMVLTAQQLLHMSYGIQDERWERTDFLRVAGADAAFLDEMDEKDYWGREGLGARGTININGVADARDFERFMMRGAMPANDPVAGRLVTDGRLRGFAGGGGGRAWPKGPSLTAGLGWRTPTDEWRLIEDFKRKDSKSSIPLERKGSTPFFAQIDLDTLQANAIEFFPPALAIDMRGRSQIYAPLEGQIIGGIQARLESIIDRTEDQFRRYKGLMNGARMEERSKQSLLLHLVWLQEMRLQNGWGQRNLIYQRPQAQADNRFFGDLTAFAPGLHTSLADIYATVEAEATTEKQPLPGIIDPGARKLIDAARASGWQTFAVPGSAQMSGYNVTFNGAGQFSYERVLDTGLHEQVICDGTTLWTLYPEIGLGGRRPFSRYHHEEIAEFVPWFLPKAEDLARGADVKFVDETTVAIVSRLPPAKDKDGKTLPTRELHMIFTDDGRLSERRILEMPSRKILIRQTYDAQGVVQVITPKDSKVVVGTKLKLAWSEAPSLKADTKDLLLMDFPVRTPAYMFSKIPNWNGSFAKLDPKLGQQLYIACVLSGDASTSWQAFAERFHAEGDHRIGFYTLYNLTGTSFSKDPSYNWGNKQITFIEREHPKNALATYLAHYQQSLTQQHWLPLENLPGPVDGFIQRLAQFRNLWTTWITDHPTRHGDKKVQEERVKALKFIQETKSPLFAWAILESVIRHGPQVGDDFYQAMDKVTKDMGDQFDLTYFTRYEKARSLQSSNKNPQARQAFEELYLDFFKAGALPPIDANFVQAFNAVANNGEDRFANFLRERLGELLKDERLYTATLLAWQTWQVGQQALANELFNRVLAGALPKEKNSVVLIGIEYLWQTGQFARADLLLEQILADPKIAERPGAWRLSAAIAEKRGLLARSVAALEKALDLEFRALPDVINLSTVRNDYRGLLSHYQQLAAAVTMLEKEAPRDLLARVVKAADRWRALDPENVEVCQLTGRILQILGAKELAWDYVTTPIGMKPNEAAPWLGLASMLQQDAAFELADRAFAMAYDAEPTNADILWSRAQNLQQIGKHVEARNLYRQIADGNWQPRFQGIQQQARGYAGK